MHIVEVVNVETFFCKATRIDSLSKASSHDFFNNIKLIFALVLQDFEVLFHVKLFVSERHDQVGILFEAILLVTKQVKTNFKAKSADVELIAPKATLGSYHILREVMLHKMQVAVFDWVLFFLKETVLDQRCMDIYAQHLERLLEYLRCQISV